MYPQVCTTGDTASYVVGAIHELTDTQVDLFYNVEYVPENPVDTERRRLFVHLSLMMVGRSTEMNWLNTHRLKRLWELSIPAVEELLDEPIDPRTAFAMEPSVISYIALFPSASPREMAEYCQTLESW